ncbi:16S rRNA (guanine(966)-N(2))-methyltransferase RsmD [Aerococcus urinaehominis]|uniref:16S rRNA (Guanine(966)-N(2))-methyltransferase RsmD n=1 Tax=Aerococcus urinaehominis TaxID=128944 RepID=A0A0X8FKI6_9LACT|nr:16S rRNA (guanine(966)-N(2))-methyltransferase RsmD [Aerococcus urinaehominis]AMB99000.1 16S rRNA (guanine(966)-N(2))-methyltransferase RsmD [Aerococcus urinaehominis]SDM62026.1 16S rRNA (guanine(966)-N(2))-methyltransferase RsmD [Aerococcus urinaehominis]
MRVIAGEHGGRRLQAVPGKNTRPTTDKNKESLFNIIGPYFAGGIALDLFAGSGALGIEALSRGCDQAYFMDRNRSAIQTIKQNIESLRLSDQAQVYPGEGFKNLTRIRSAQPDLQFDLVFLDPPYHEQKLLANLETLLADHWLADQAVVVCEMEEHDQMPDQVGALTCIKNVVYGLTRFVIYEKEA